MDEIAELIWLACSNLNTIFVRTEKHFFGIFLITQFLP